MVDFGEKVAEDIKVIYNVFLVHLNTTSVNNCAYQMYLLYTAANGNFRCFISMLVLRRCRNRYFAEVKFAYHYDAIEKYREE